MILGITGGIASGKSTVSDYLTNEHDFPLIDADLVAREVVEPGEPALDEVFEMFGEELRNKDGSLNRSALGEKVFSDSEALERLEKILHPQIRHRIIQKMRDFQASGKHEIIVLDIPLLYEADYDRFVDKVMVVSVSPEVQLERLMQRNELTKEEAMQRINSQMALEEKVKRADVVIHNDGTPEETYAQVEQGLKKLN